MTIMSSPRRRRATMAILSNRLFFVLFFFLSFLSVIRRRTVVHYCAAAADDNVDNDDDVPHLVQKGLTLVQNGEDELGMTLIEQAVNLTAASSTPYDLLPRQQLFVLSNFVGRWRMSRHEYTPARKAVDYAWHTKPNDVCTTVMSSALLDYFPSSIQAADESLRLYDVKMSMVVESIKQHKSEAKARQEFALDPWTVSMVGGLARDPYDHCVPTLFYHSFYYREDGGEHNGSGASGSSYRSIANNTASTSDTYNRATSRSSGASSDDNNKGIYKSSIRQRTSMHFTVASTLFPELLYQSPRAKQHRLALQSADGKHSTNVKPCIHDRKIKLGIASGFFTESSSVTLDFNGVLRRLDRSLFDITYLYFDEHGGGDQALKSSPPANFILDNRDTHYIYTKDAASQGGPTTRHRWIQKAHREVSTLELDLLLFLDVTMSTHVHRFAMGRVAPVQIVSHGHPITSGFPREVMDYYVSWAAAELTLEEAQSHYTEELKLLPADTLHQYYEPRVLEGGTKSASDGMSFKHFLNNGRRALLPNIPDDGAAWYLCMQKPFKLHPEFDSLVAGILRADPTGRVLLHEETFESNRQIFVQRLQQAGCDMSRLHFVPVQPHHRLLALYKVSDVILDSYPAGGCTTTREVLELHKVVVTLPARYLGSRWTLGYYNILNDTALTAAVVANSEEEYVQLAVRLGTNQTARDDAERRIKENVPKLFHRMEAVEEWTKMLLNLAPVRLPDENGHFIDEAIDDGAAEDESHAGYDKTEL